MCKNLHFSNYLVMREENCIKSLKKFWWKKVCQKYAPFCRNVQLLNSFWIHLNTIGNKTMPFCKFLAYVTRPTVCAHPISVMGSVMGQLYYCYGSHYEMGVVHTVGGTLLFCYVHKFNVFTLSMYNTLFLWDINEQKNCQSF